MAPNTTSVNHVPSSAGGKKRRKKKTPTGVAGAAVIPEMKVVAVDLDRDGDADVLVVEKEETAVVVVDEATPGKKRRKKKNVAKSSSSSHKAAAAVVQEPVVVAKAVDSSAASSGKKRRKKKNVAKSSSSSHKAAAAVVQEPVVVAKAVDSSAASSGKKRRKKKPAGVAGATKTETTVTAVDLDGDGDADVMMAEPTETKIIAVDLDGDGDADVMVVEKTETAVIAVDSPSSSGKKRRKNKAKSKSSSSSSSSHKEVIVADVQMDTHVMDSNGEVRQEAFEEVHIMARGGSKPSSSLGESLRSNSIKISAEDILDLLDSDSHCTASDAVIKVTQHHKKGPAGLFHGCQVASSSSSSESVHRIVGVRPAYPFATCHTVNYTQSGGSCSSGSLSLMSYSSSRRKSGSPRGSPRKSPGRYSKGGLYLGAKVSPTNPKF